MSVKSSYKWAFLTLTWDINYFLFCYLHLFMYVCAIPYFLYNLNVFVSPEMHNYVFWGVVYKRDQAKKAVFRHKP